LIKPFKAFNIIFIPRFYNVVADTLANATIIFTPLRDGLSIEVVYKPTVPDNITNLRVFNDDQKTLEFMTSVEVFKMQPSKKRNMKVPYNKKQTHGKETLCLKEWSC